jgi:hypothetical protein
MAEKEEEEVEEEAAAEVVTACDSEEALDLGAPDGGGTSSRSSA